MQIRCHGSCCCDITETLTAFLSLADFLGQFVCAKECRKCGELTNQRTGSKVSSNEKPALILHRRIEDIRCLLTDSDIQTRSGNNKYFNQNNISAEALQILQLLKLLHSV